MKQRPMNLSHGTDNIAYITAGNTDPVEPNVIQNRILRTLMNVRSPIFILFVSITWRSTELPNLRILEKEFRIWVENLPKYPRFDSVPRLSKNFDRSRISIRPVQRMNNPEKCIRNFVVSTGLT